MRPTLLLCVLVAFAGCTAANSIAACGGGKEEKPPIPDISAADLAKLKERMQAERYTEMCKKMCNRVFDECSEETYQALGKVSAADLPAHIRDGALDRYEAKGRRGCAQGLCAEKMNYIRRLELDCMKHTTCKGFALCLKSIAVEGRAHRKRMGSK